MNVLKGIGRVLAGVLLLMALAVPLVLIHEISKQEMEKYQEPVQGEYKPSAYGELAAVSRQDMEESIEISGNFVSNSYVFQELKYKDPGKIRWLVHSGDMTTQGELLGLYEGKEVISEVTGIIENISLGYEDAYIQYKTTDGLELECRVEDKILSILKGGGLKTEAGEAVSLNYTAPLKNEDGTTTVRLKIEGAAGYLGQSVPEMKLFTGRIFYDSLVLPEKCVYQKDPGQDAPWYARQISADGYFIQEVEVAIGYSDGENVCVTGVGEGEFYDTGYKAILGSQ